MQNLHNESKKISCAIFAGGENKRMRSNGHKLPSRGQAPYGHKAFLKHPTASGGKSFIEVMRDNMRNWFSEVFIVTNDSKLFKELEIEVFEDIIPAQGPLGALYTALYASSNDKVFCIACDMVGYYESLLEQLIKSSIGSPRGDRPHTGTGTLTGTGTHTGTSSDFDCFVIRSKQGIEPLFAIYNTRIKQLVKKQIESGDLKLSRLLDSCLTFYVDVDIDKGQLININTPKEYEEYASEIQDMA